MCCKLACEYFHVRVDEGKQVLGKVEPAGLDMIKRGKAKGD
jgi:hypothetical protein